MAGSNAESHSDGRFNKYKVVEAYEIRPGILMMPRYSADGRVCEIGLQKRLYSPEVVRLDPEMDRKEIDGIVNELAPPVQRGPQSAGLLGRGLSMIAGNSEDQLEEYENVSIDVFSEVISNSKRGAEVESNLVATIRWKHRKCG